MQKKDQPANNQSQMTWQPSSKIGQQLPAPVYMPPPAKQPGIPVQPSAPSPMPGSTSNFVPLPAAPVSSQLMQPPSFQNSNSQPQSSKPPSTPVQWNGPKPSFMPQGIEQLSKLDTEGNYPPFLTVSWTEWMDMHTRLIQGVTRYQRALSENDPCSANRIALEMLNITTKMIGEATARLEAQA